MGFGIKPCVHLLFRHQGPHALMRRGKMDGMLGEYGAIARAPVEEEHLTLYEDVSMEGEYFPTT